MTGDIGRRNRSGQVEFLGRQDFTIRLHGRTIDTLALENTLSSIDGVARAALARVETVNGHPLKAYVQLEKGTHQTIGHLRRECEARGQVLPPMGFVSVDNIRLDKNGKVDRTALQRASSDPLPAATCATLICTSAEGTVGQIVGELLGIEVCGRDERFEDLGGDSLFALNLTLALEEQLGANLPPSRVMQLATVRRVADAVQRREVCQPTATLASGPHDTTLFCLHSMSGDVADYRFLAREMRGRCTVVGIRQDASTHDKSIHDLACAAEHHVRDIQPHGPYNLCGNCFGGLVAFELAQSLTSAGEAVAFLGLIDTAFPRGTIEHFFQHSVPTNVREMSALTPRQKARFVAAKGKRRLRRYPEPAIHRRNRMLQASYRPKRYDGPTTLFLVGAPRSHRGWEYVARDLELVTMLPDAGDPLNPQVVSVPHVRVLADLLVDRLLGRIPALQAPPA